MEGCSLRWWKTTYIYCTSALPRKSPAKLYCSSFKAYLLVQEPKYAFIDEGTSAVSQDVEGLLYETAKERGITLITISTRAQLKKYHTFQLQLDGPNGGWEFDRIGTERERSSVENELRELKEKVQNVKALRERLKTVEEELARVFVTGGEELPGFEQKSGESSRGIKEGSVVVKSGSGTEEHTAEEVTSEETKSGDDEKTPSEGDENKGKQVDLEKESFADAVKKGTDE
jgi:ATP-binding cassette subfamily D (ALD) long-chain fatty acid import protein